jgi:hypothetical protein
LSWAKRPGEGYIKAAWALTFISFVVFVAHFGLARSLTAYGWNRTMDEMGAIIADIERF